MFGGRRSMSALAVVGLVLALAVAPAGAGDDKPVTMFRQHQVHRLYLAAFGRPPDAAGLQHWLGSDLSLREIAINIAESPEFLRRYDQADDLAFVEQLHLDVVGEPGDPQMLRTLAYGLSFLPRGCTGPARDDPVACPEPHRGAVVLGYANSADLIARLGGDPGAAIRMGSFDQIRRLYGAAFDRMPDASEVQYWLWGMPEAERSEGDLDETSFVPVRSVAESFVLAPEFVGTYGALTNRDFVERLYASAFDRAPEPPALAYWGGLLDRGAARSAVLLQIANSYELAYRLALATAR
ncbi:MAG TPA: DUF4214 domain-containing protein [Acidimicrobiales bacterium]|nr:DUF4214 domain-containing protein [Acidimicrobiales bacterium]